MNKLKLYLNFKDTKQPKYIDYCIVIGTMLLYLFLSRVRDLPLTIDHGLLLIEAIFKGKFFEIYSYIITNSHSVHAANYEIFIFIIFAIWNIPIYIINLIKPFNYMDNMIVILYNQLLLIIFMLGISKCIYKISFIITEDTNKSKWSNYFFLTSTLLIIPAFWFSQYDIISVFFATLGTYYYIKNDTKKFILSYALAIPMKLFALFIFIPLLLLKEKRIKYIILEAISVCSLWVGAKLLFINDLGYKVSMGKFTQMMIDRLISCTIMSGVKSIPILLTLYTLIYIWCYWKQCETKNEEYYYTIYIPFIIYFLFIVLAGYPYPYWFIILVPYSAIIMIINYEKLKINLLLDIAIWISFYISCSDIYDWIFVDYMINEKILPHSLRIDASLRKYQNIYQMLEYYHLSKYLPLVYAVFIGCVIVVLIINHPKYLMQNSNKNLYKIERSIVWTRAFIPLFFMGMTFLCYFSIKCINAIDTIYTNSYEKSLIRIAENGNELEQYIIFDKPYELQELDLMLYTEPHPVLSYSSLEITMEDIEEQEQVFYLREHIGVIPNEQIYTMKINKINVYPNKQYKLSISGRDDRNDEAYVAITKQNILGDNMPLLINGKQVNNNLYFSFKAKNKDKTVKTMVALENLNAEIDNIKWNNDIKEANEKKIIEITVRNTGLDAWSESNNIRLCCFENNMDVERGFIEKDKIVYPNEIYTFNINVTDEINDLNNYSFQMVQEGFKWFGERSTLNEF